MAPRRMAEENDRQVRGAVAAGVVAFLAGCAGQPDTEYYLAYCVSQGLELGSDLFFQCVDQQRAKDLMEAQQVRAMRGLRPDR